MEPVCTQLHHDGRAPSRVSALLIHSTLLDVSLSELVISCTDALWITDEVDDRQFLGIVSSHNHETFGDETFELVAGHCAYSSCFLKMLGSHK